MDKALKEAKARDAEREETQKRLERNKKNYETKQEMLALAKEYDDREREKKERAYEAQKAAEQKVKDEIAKAYMARATEEARSRDAEKAETKRKLEENRRKYITKQIDNSFAKVNEQAKDILDKDVSETLGYKRYKTKKENEKLKKNSIDFANKLSNKIKTMSPENAKEYLLTSLYNMENTVGDSIENRKKQVALEKELSKLEKENKKNRTQQSYERAYEKGY